MSDKPVIPPKRDASREDRLAAALRENLRRRKVQERDRRDPPPPSPDAPPADAG